jgi:hypothetical protein
MESNIEQQLNYNLIEDTLDSYKCVNNLDKFGKQRHQSNIHNNDINPEDNI